LYSESIEYDRDRTFLFDKIYYYDYDRGRSYYHRCSPCGYSIIKGRCSGCDATNLPSQKKLNVMRGLKELVD